MRTNRFARGAGLRQRPRMRVGVVQFPGSNCEHDVLAVVREGLGLDADLIWHKETSVSGCEAVVLPGGFSFGDYLRCGAIARFSPIMKAVADYAAQGGRVVGICNGFQILCEAGLLPGALVRNTVLEYRCETLDLAIEDSTEAFNRSTLGARVRLPIGHGEGNFRIDDAGLATLEANGQVLLRYAPPRGNPNGSINDIAGVRNAAGNVLGLMPHPDRAFRSFHPSDDGLAVMEALLGRVPVRA